MLDRKCQLLASLHVPGSPLVLPNAWDVASAKAVVAAGFPVVATTSAGVAASLGYDDDEGAPREEMLAAARRIAASVDVPVTVDAEAGYGMSLRELVEALAGLGAAGCNLEDTDHATGGLRDPGRHAEWVSAVRGAADAVGYSLVINARVDVFLASRDTRPQLRILEDAVGRARSYLSAGANCVFPIFLSERDAIAAFVEAVDGPVNILAVPEAPTLAALSELGVARVSYGSLLQARVMERLDELLRELG